MKKNKNIKILLFENMGKLNPEFSKTGYNYEASYGEAAYDDKVQQIKNVIDRLHQEQEYDVLETLYRLLVARKKSPNNQTLNNQLEEQEILNSLKKLL